MIERHVTFNVIPGKEMDFETLFKNEYRVAMSKQPGFGSVTLLKEHEKDATYQMVIRFQSLETAAPGEIQQTTRLFPQGLRPSIKKVPSRSTK